jgi:hypothetical protein
MKIAVILSGTMLALALAGVAHADSKIASGIGCQPLYGPEKVDGQGLSHGYSGIMNTAADKRDRVVMCPISVDVTSNTAGLATASNGVSLKLSGAANGKALQCGALSLTQYGSIVLSVFKNSTATPGNTEIDWGTTMNKSANHGSYAFQCTLPTGAFINAIEYNEP